MFQNNKFIKYIKLVSLTMLIMFSFLFLSSCIVIETDDLKDDIVILYTNDVHARYTENIGYSGLSSYKTQMEEEHEHVTLIDLGDAIQGDLISLFTKGQNVIDLMNKVGYDFAILGNHEFDFGFEALGECIDAFEGQYLTANIDVLEEGVDYFDDVLPYEIVSYGDQSVAYIGLITPYTISSSTPAFFQDEEGNYLVNFWSYSAEFFYENVQNIVDEVNDKGADHVVICGHLGDNESIFSSRELIKNITGVDVVLDGHAHNVIEQEVLKDKLNNDVILSSTGTDLKNIGKLTISSRGEIKTELISSVSEKDLEIEQYISNMQAELDTLLSEVITSSNNDLSIFDEEGVRIVRTRETTMGNLCADALRMFGNTQIGFINGGAIRDYLQSGDITYRDLYNVFPFGNGIASIKLTGQMILDALELSVSNVQSEYKVDGYPIGESGGFLQVSGLKFEVDTSIPSSVVLDENEMFVEVLGERRIKNCCVYNSNGEYEPINPDAYYTATSIDYLIVDAGNGYSMFNNDLIINYDTSVKDIEVLVNYLNYLEGDLSKYQNTEDRITIK